MNIPPCTPKAPLPKTPRTLQPVPVPLVAQGCEVKVQAPITISYEMRGHLTFRPSG